jgi:hypothetical protein
MVPAQSLRTLRKRVQESSMAQGAASAESAADLAAKVLEAVLAQAVSA